MKKAKKDGLIKLALLVIPVLIAAIMVNALNRPTKLNTPEIANNALHSIVRLHDKSTGRFFCSGLVVSSTVIITAAHCVVGRPGDVATVSVQATKDSTIGVDATVLAYNERADLATLKGDFRVFSSRAIETDPTRINDIAFSNKKIVACGFAWGGDLVCSPVIARARCFFSICGQGFLYPGMSGGPVIDLETGKAIALNTAVSQDSVVLSPYVNIFDILKGLPDNE